MTFTASWRSRWLAGVAWLGQRWAQPGGRWLSWRSLLWAGMALGGAVVLYVLLLIPMTPATKDIRKAKLDQPAQLMSADGKQLAEYRWVNRAWVPLERVAPSVVDALIATEDHRFYDHFGMDWRRTASSVVHTLRGDPQGGSTITQQLARNLFPEEIGRSRTITRKLKEAITALKIESSYTKDEILETYLNTVPFLYNAYGIEMAARTYFDKSASKLTVLESATLIGMLKGTAYYNPVRNPERATARRNTVLSQMHKRGKIETAQFEQLKKRPLRVDFERQTEVMGPAPHFAQQLRKQLIAWADSKGYSLYSDGLVIHTTINSRLQAYANQAVARQGRQLQTLTDNAWSGRNGWNARNPLVASLVRETSEYKAAVDGGEEPDEALKKLLADDGLMRKLRAEKTRVQAGFLAQDPVTGHVLAWVGSRDFGTDPFDHVQAAKRQPGSIFKPFVYGAAFAQGASPSDTLMDTAVAIDVGGGQIWRPTDGGAPSEQPMTLADGLAYSKNTITAQVMQQVGPARVATLARALGVRQSALEEVPSLALGTSPVTLSEMVSAYSSIANSGRYVEPVLLTRIENAQGEVLETFATAPVEVVMPLRPAQTLRNAMRGAIDKGTATAIRTRYGIQGDVAGKTGTTQDNTDGWFLLMHARVVAGAWVGFNDGRITLRSDAWGQGARSALPIVGEFVQQAFRSNVLNGRDRFVDEESHGFGEETLNEMRDWIRRMFRGGDGAAPAGAGSVGGGVTGGGTDDPSRTSPMPPPAAWPIDSPPRGGQPLPPVTGDDGAPLPRTQTPSPPTAPSTPYPSGQLPAEVGLTPQPPAAAPAAQGADGEGWMERLRRRADPLLPPAGPDGNRTTPPGTPVQPAVPNTAPRPASPDGSPATR